MRLRMIEQLNEAGTQSPKSTRRCWWWTLENGLGVGMRVAPIRRRGRALTDCLSGSWSRSPRNRVWEETSNSGRRFLLVGLAFAGVLRRQHSERTAAGGRG
jgi:hypothetical protein